MFGFSQEWLRNSTLEKDPKMSDINLSSAVRTSLNSLQSTADLLTTTQERLATGNRVNSALDDPTAFFTASALNNRASDLSTLLDGQQQAIRTVEAADQGLTAISDLIDSARAQATAALQTEDADARTAAGTAFNDILRQIEGVAEDSSFNGTNLLEGDDLTAVFNEAGDNTLTVSGVDLSVASDAAGLNLADVTFTDDASINDALSAIDSALGTVRSTSASLGADLSTIQIRQDFTSNLINTLEAGAGDLTLADLNEEGANLLTLQTRQSLASTSLSFATQSDQSVLSLF